jgi:hypothetical protein
MILLGVNFHRKPKEFDITYESKEVVCKFYFSVNYCEKKMVNLHDNRIIGFYLKY